jgi:hypothetical protein
MKWTWSYELHDLGNSTTQVTEIFDGHSIPAFSRWWLTVISLGALVISIIGMVTEYEKPIVVSAH